MYIYIHACMHTYIHTYIYIYIYIYISLSLLLLLLLLIIIMVIIIIRPFLRVLPFRVPLRRMGLRLSSTCWTCLLARVGRRRSGSGLWSCELRQGMRNGDRPTGAREETLLLCQPLPCSPAAGTALQPLIWCFEGPSSPGSSSPQECFFHRHRGIISTYYIEP